MAQPSCCTGNYIWSQLPPLSISQKQASVVRYSSPIWMSAGHVLLQLVPLSSEEPDKLLMKSRASMNSSFLKIKAWKWRGRGDAEEK